MPATVCLCIAPGNKHPTFRLTDLQTTFHGSDSRRVAKVGSGPMGVHFREPSLTKSALNQPFTPLIVNDLSSNASLSRQRSRVRVSSSPPAFNKLEICNVNPQQS
jgi:hypothetical protein